MSFFSVAISGLESIDEDFQAEEKKIERQIPSALHFVGSEMIVNLKKHIYEDWYKKYTPKVYERRTDDPSLGQGLRSLDYMDVQVSGKDLLFTYEPSGEHAEEIWHTRDGDDLITFLQVGTDYMPPRPFWNNFVGEQRDGGIMEAFMRGMKPYVVIPEGHGKDVVFDGGESELDAAEPSLTFFGNDTEEELPF